MKWERLLASSSASMGTLKREPADEHFRTREGGRVAAADDATDRSFPANGRDFDRSVSAQLGHHRNHRLPNREEARANLLATFENRVARIELDHCPERFDQPSRFT